MVTTSEMMLRRISALKPNPRNARTHSKKQVDQIARSVDEFGFTNPILVDDEGVLIAGHGRLEAAKRLNLDAVPVIELGGLTDHQKHRLMLADNKIAQNAGWDRERLSIELEELIIEGADISIIGFEPPEIDQLRLDFEHSSADPLDDVPPAPVIPVTITGDLWLLGKHRLLCGDARNTEDVEKLCGSDRAVMAFLDPPYNVKVANIVGRGSIQHAEFAMASGEMSSDEFHEFLRQTLQNAVRFSTNGAVHYVCMDWRHIDGLMAVARRLYQAILNLVAWVKSNAGQGSFYRSQHELIGVFRVGDGPHLNNVELGRHGRYRSNVWHYAGINSFRSGRLDDLQAHPTVKPVAMVADAIKDCTRRDEIVLDLFGGSGTTMLACERVGRRALMLEYEPRYVDVAIRRWQEFTGKDAIHAASGEAFNDAAKAAKEVS